MRLSWIEKICFSLLIFYVGVFLMMSKKNIHVEQTKIIKENPILNEPTIIKQVLHQEISPSLQMPSSVINQFYYDSILPIPQEKLSDLKVYDVYLGENTSMKEALGWLKYRFPQKIFQTNFSYALYNNEDQKEVSFDFRIKEPPPKDFCLAYFQGGKRDGKNDIYSLDILQQMGNGASHLYLFWSKPKPFQEQKTVFYAENYHPEIIYEKGTNFGGPSYFFIDKIVLKDLSNNKIVGVYPINQKIEEPFVMLNYDFELKFPFYNYEQEGMLWYTNKIKSLRKIDLYEKRTKQKRTLFYDIV